MALQLLCRSLRCRLLSRHGTARLAVHSHGGCCLWCCCNLVRCSLLLPIWLLLLLRLVLLLLLRLVLLLLLLPR